MKRKMLSILLAFVMVCSLLPVTAMAAGAHHTCGDSCGHVAGDPHKTVDSEEWTGVSNQADLQDAATNGGNVYLTDDIVLAASSSGDPTITVASGKTLNLCLNGHTIKPDENSNFPDWGQAFTVSGGATFNLTDCSTAIRLGYIDTNASYYQNLWKEGTSTDAADITCNLIGGTITGFTSRNGGAVHNYGNFTMYACNISGNACGDCGGVYNKGNFTMNGSSTICGNVATTGCGGGVRNFSSGSSITMNGGHIIYNKANRDGGGIYLVGGSTAKLNGATIQHNIAGSAGGGIYLESDSTAELNGATIQHNIAGNADGGGVYFGGASLELSGMCTITGNRKGNADNNVYLARGKTITVSSTGLDNGTRIGVTTKNKPDGDTTVAITGENSNDYSGCFVSDDLDSYHIENGANNVVVLKAGATLITYTVTFNANGATGTVPTQVATAEGGTFLLPTATDLAKDGYTFVGWNDGTTTYRAGDTYTMPASVVVFTAQWEIIPTYNLWVGGVQVSDANKDDLVEAINRVANATVATGKATYDPDTKTITLTNFKYTGEHENGSDYETSAISVKENGITIVFSGENMIEGTGYCGLYAGVEDHIRLKAADKNSTLTFTCDSTRAFWHKPVLVEIDIYAGESEADAKFRTPSAFADYPYYDFKYVKFVPATDTDTPAPQPPVYYPPVDPTPVIPSVDVDIHNDSLSAAAKAVGAAVKSGKADIIPAEGYTKESIAKMQNSGELNLVIEKNAGYDEAEKKLLDDAITAKGGAAGSVMYLEIDALLMSDDGKVVAEVDDTIVPLTITVELNAEMQKAAKEGKTIYVARAHDGKVAFIEGTLNADKTKLTFDSSKFSTYALVASDGETITSAQTADAGILLAVSMSILSVTGSAVLLKKKED